jgi:hypothetical protein
MTQPITAPLTQSIISTNPLRAGEPGIVFAPETSTWGSDDNAQKVWQHVAMGFDRCDVLDRAMRNLGDANDFAMRTLASYLVLELHCMFEMLVTKRKPYLNIKDGKPLSRTKNPVLKNLEKQARDLMGSDSEFGQLRDKLIAHLDGELDVVMTTELWQHITAARISEWSRLLAELVNELAKDFPNEFNTHLGVRNEPTSMKVNRGYEDYVPFASGS